MLQINWVPANKQTSAQNQTWIHDLNIHVCLLHLKSMDVWVGDVAPNSLRDPKVGPRVKQRNKKRIGARFLICNTSGVGGHARASRWD
jgi:hypothetical protein